MQWVKENDIQSEKEGGGRPFGLLKVCKLNKKIINNKGSAVLEMCLIMPVVIIICFGLITLFFDNINDALVRGNIYTALYSYSEDKSDNICDEVYSDIREEAIGTLRLNISHNQNKNSVSLVTKDEEQGIGAYIYENKGLEYKTEYGICTKRLRGWQFYGDKFCE